jgi:hypothetical protein
MGCTGMIFLQLLIIPLFGVVFFAFWAFNELVKRFYSQYRDEWESAGCPRGVFWSPDLRGFFSITSLIAMYKLAITLIFKTPEWVKQEQSSIRLLRTYRKTFLIWNLGILFWAAVMIFSLRRT